MDHKVAEFPVDPMMAKNKEYRLIDWLSKV